MVIIEVLLAIANMWADSLHSYRLLHDKKEEEAKITPFEDFSSEIINGTKYFGFQWSPSEEGNETLVFENGKILFSNGTVLLS